MTCGLPTAIMKRREFITLLGGSAAWPLAARAQQGERMRRVGLLMNTTSEESEAQSHVAAFQQGMQENGWSVGRNLRVDLRWGGADTDLTRRHAAELVALSPDVMVAAGGPVVSAIQRESRTVPIVFAQSIDPIGAGIVASLARPGGNATGFMQFEYGLSAKWPELLKEIPPGTKRVGVLRDTLMQAGSDSGLLFKLLPMRREWKPSRSRSPVLTKSNAASQASPENQTVVWSCRSAPTQFGIARPLSRMLHD